MGKGTLLIALVVCLVSSLSAVPASGATPSHQRQARAAGAQRVARAAQASDICSISFPHQREVTYRIAFGTKNIYNQDLSRSLVCSGAFGAPDNVQFSVGAYCDFVAAIFGAAAPQSDYIGSWFCAGATAATSGIVSAGTGKLCGYLADVLGTGIGVFAAGVTLDPGVGVVVWRGATFFGSTAVCVGLNDGVAKTWALNHETDHEMAVAHDIRLGKCLQLTQQRLLGISRLNWSAIDCPSGFTNHDSSPFHVGPSGGSGGGSNGPGSVGSGTGGSNGSGNSGTAGSVQIGWSSTHPGWITMTLNGFGTGSHQYSCDFGSGGDQTFTLGESSDPQTWDNGQTCYDLISGDTVWVTVNGVTSNTLTVGSSAPPPTQPPPATPASVQIGWSSVHPGWITMTLNGFGTGSHQYSCDFGSGGDQTFTLGESSDPETWDNGQTCYDLISGDTVWVTVNGVTSNTLTVGSSAPPPPPPTTWSETTGGVAHTWTNYTNAGGTQGPSIGANQTVQIACALTGFRVADGNTWWYRIASAPWSGVYYVSADAFYNNGRTSGSLLGTPFVDPAVAGC